MHLQDEKRTLATRLRTILLWVLILSAVGVGAELVLTEHTDGIWQLTPLVLIGLSLGLLAGVLVFRRPALVRAFQVSMGLCLISGGVGLVLHYWAKMEFKLELDPTLGGWALFWQTIKGPTMPPILAPGVMFQLGLLGLAYAYRHPASTSSTKTDTPTTKGNLI